LFTFLRNFGNLTLTILAFLRAGKMTTCDEKHSLAHGKDDDTVSVGTTCLAQDDVLQSSPEDVSHDECEQGRANVTSYKTDFSYDECEQGRVDIPSYKTDSFWDDCEMPETSILASQDTNQIGGIPETSTLNFQETTQAQNVPVWVPIPSAPMVVPVVTCNNNYPQLDAAQLLQQASDCQREAARLEAEARRCRNTQAMESSQADVASGITNTSWTTVMLRNIPNNIMREGLLDRFERSGFAGCFDFLYLPMDFKRDANLGYAFVNLINWQQANRFYEFFQGFNDWGLASQKVCQVCWGQPLQGLEKHVERYRNSPVMHNSVADQHKPILFRDGVRIPFPEPTKRIRAPRVSDRP